MRDNTLYKHKRTGEYFEYLGMKNGFMLLKSLITGRKLHITPEFLEYYQEVKAQ